MRTKLKTGISIALVLSGLAPSLALAQPKNSSPKNADVSKIREKYWARGEESELGVVQDRLYTKKNRLEISAFGGLMSSDPFLDVKGAGGTLGFHFSETLAAHVVYWKAFASNSSALDTFEAEVKATTNTNKPSSYLGGEIGASFLYGKLSLAGASIIHYDLHLLGGAGVTSTETGHYVTPSIGLGQNIYVTSRISLRLDYRLMYYREAIHEKVKPAPERGQFLNYRNNWTNALTLGFSFMI